MEKSSIRRFRALRDAFRSGRARHLVVGIDVAKQAHAVWLRFDGRDLVTDPLRVSASREGLEQLEKAIEKQRRKLGLERSQVVVGLEPSGQYHKPLASFLLHCQYHVVCISGTSVKRQRDLQYRDWSKTDRRDCQVISELVSRGYFQFFIPCDPEIEQMRVLLANFRVVSKRAAQARHRLISGYLSYIFPEMDKFVGKWKARWVIEFLKVFPTPHTIREYSKDQFVRQAAPLLKGRASRYTVLDQIYEEAQNSIGLQETPLRTYATQCAILLQELEYLIDWKRRLENQLEVLFAESLDFKILRSVPGIGTIVAATVLASIGTIAFFDHPREFIKFVGLNLSLVQSGAYKGRLRISKCGRADVRHALYLAAITAIRQPGNSFYVKYRQLVRSKPEDRDLCRRARIAICVKMARVIFALLKKQEFYHPKVEVVNSIA